MSGGRSWTTTEAKRLKELRAQRVPMRKIAKELGRTEQAIYSFLRYVPATKDEPARMGPVERYPPRQKIIVRNDYWTREEIATLAEMIAEGASSTEIAEVVGRTVKAVRGKASYLGLKLGHRGGNSVYRLDQESNRYYRDAVQGSAKLLNALLELAA